MSNSTPLSKLRSLLVVGARIVTRFEPVTIRGNLGTSVIPGREVSRTVESVSSARVSFREDREDGGKVSWFYFPSTFEISMEGESFVWTSMDGHRILSYTPVPALQCA